MSKIDLGLSGETVGLPNKLSDVGAFSYSSLCGVSLLQLFDDEFNRDFKTSAVDAILQHLDLPTQVCDSVKAITDGSGIDDCKPYADELLKDPCLHGSGIPVITDLVTLAISHGCYDSRMRMLIKHVAWQLRVSWDHMEEIEALLAETLEAKQYEMSEEEENEKKKKSRNQKIKRIALVGFATVGGGALIGLTGGLAAPLVAAGASAIIGGAGAAALGSTAGVAIIGSLFGVAGAGLTGHKMNRRFGAIQEFRFEPMVSGGALQRAPTSKQLHITVAITGWLSTSMDDVKIPWKNLAESQEQYCLRYESKHLSVLGEAIEYFISGAVSMATQEALKYTVLSAIITAIAWPAALISASNVIDNPWSVCIQRTIATGKELAETLLSRTQGNRPVTLIGYSLGARVIFYCLEEMAKRKCCEGIIEDVILLGAPVTGDVKSWKPFRKVVAGKIINGYSKADWLLKFLYRTSSVQLSVAGLQPIKWNDRRMHNIDLSDIVGGHGDYLKELDTIMKIVGVRTKQDIVILPLTSGAMMARNDSFPSLTSSEGSDEEGMKTPPDKSKEKNGDFLSDSGAISADCNQTEFRKLDLNREQEGMQDNDISEDLNKRTNGSLCSGKEKSESYQYIAVDKLDQRNSVPEHADKIQETKLISNNPVDEMNSSLGYQSEDTPITHSNPCQRKENVKSEDMQYNSNVEDNSACNSNVGDDNVGSTDNTQSEIVTNTTKVHQDGNIMNGTDHGNSSVI